MGSLHIKHNHEQFTRISFWAFAHRADDSESQENKWLHFFFSCFSLLFISEIKMFEFNEMQYQVLCVRVCVSVCLCMWLSICDCVCVFNQSQCPEDGKNTAVIYQQTPLWPSADGHLSTLSVCVRVCVCLRVCVWDRGRHRERDVAPGSWQSYGSLRLSLFPCVD